MKKSPRVSPMTRSQDPAVKTSPLPLGIGGPSSIGTDRADEPVDDYPDASVPTPGVAAGKDANGSDWRELALSDGQAKRKLRFFRP